MGGAGFGGRRSAGHGSFSGLAHLRKDQRPGYDLRKTEEKRVFILEVIQRLGCDGGVFDRRDEESSARIDDVA